MATPGYSMVYDIQTYIKNRQKQTLPLLEFFERTGNNELFLIEFSDTTHNGDHVILWCRRSKLTQYDPSSTVLVVYDARIFDELTASDHKLASCDIDLSTILAMRINQERFNWDYDSRMFIQE